MQCKVLAGLNLLMFNMFLTNYETLKLVVKNPELSNLLIFVIILCVCVCWKKTAPQKLLSKYQTDQLRGLAIILVIIGHLWEHVADSAPKMLFSDDGVALFLLISGYGLMTSYKDKPRMSLVFVKRRLRRVMVPYWVITAFLVALDYFLLGRIYQLKDIVMTMLGININVTTHSIDYARWYITFLLLWYTIFLFAISVFKDWKNILFLFVCAAVLFPFDYYVGHFAFYSFSLFALGCAIGVYYPVINKALSRKPLYFVVGAIIALSAVIAYKFTASIILQSYLPSIVVKAFNEANTILFSLSVAILIVVFGMKGYQSTYLCFCGSISYELFLLHGAFLIKYNPIIIRNGSVLIFSFAIFFLCLNIMSWIAHRGFTTIHVT